MEPFQLLCPGCASKLKVRNRSAIGQRLACPKCRQMILVEAPEGHDIGESKLESASFDDMDLDALLENRPPASAKKPPQVSANIPRPQKPVVTTRQPSQTSQPQQRQLAPNEDWVNPATKKKQRLVLMIMAGFGGLLAIGALTVFLLSGSGAGDSEVAVVPDDVKEETKDATTVTEPVVEPKAKVDDAAVERAEPVTEPKLVVEEPAAVPDIGDAPPIAGVPDTPPGIAGTDLETAMVPEGFGDEASPNDATTRDTTPDKPKNELDKLKSMLAESGTSLLEIQTAASVVRNDFAIGTPKYFFEKILFEPTDSNRTKDQVLLGVKFDQQPLQTVLHELSAISGLQLTIDVPTIATAGKDFNPKVDLQVENESTASVIRKVADSVGLTAIETDHGFWITVKSNNEFQEEAIGVSLLVDEPNDGFELVQLVSQLIYPGTWKAEAGGPDADPNQPKGTISFAEGRLKLNHSAVVIREVQKLIDGIKAVSREDANGSPLLKPIPWIDAGGFTKQLEPMNSVRVTIGKFIRGFNDDHGVQLLGDWHSLGQTGWTCDSMAPGRIEERSVGDVVKETAHGMGSAFYVVDEKTVWITAPQIANNIFLLKLYPLEKLADGRLTKQRLAHILADSLGSQMAQPGVAFYVLPKQKLVAVRAPQSLHRQLSVVFSAIK